MSEEDGHLHQAIVGLEDTAYHTKSHEYYMNETDLERWREYAKQNSSYNTMLEERFGFNRIIVVREWESLWNYIDTAINLKSPLKDHERASRSEGSTEWAGGSWEDAVNRAQAGWPEGVHLARDFADDVRFEIEDEYQLVYTPNIMHQQAGQMVDIGRFLAGEPEAMMDILVEEKSKPVVKILVNSAASFRIKPEVVVRRGAIVVALVDLLENMNMRCEVVMCVALEAESFGGVNGLQYFVTVKKPEHTLQIDALMFMMANPGSLRRIAFSVMETEPSEVRTGMDINKWGGYGYPTNPVEYPHDIFVPALTMGSGDFNTDEGAKSWLLEVLREQGLTFFNKEQEL